jgi:DNA-directed RNA polymerase subunit N (RpoN/RPB10)
MILPVLFHLLKRCEDWNEFVEHVNRNLESNSEVKNIGIERLSAKFFFLMLLSNADTLL